MHVRVFAILFVFYSYPVLLVFSLQYRLPFEREPAELLTPPL